MKKRDKKPRPKHQAAEAMTEGELSEVSGGATVSGSGFPTKITPTQSTQSSKPTTKSDEVNQYMDTKKVPPKKPKFTEADIQKTLNKIKFSF